MTKLVIPLLAVLLAACLLCAGVSAGDITIGSSSKSGSGSIDLTSSPIEYGVPLILTVELTQGTIKGPVNLAVTTDKIISMKDMEISYIEENVSDIVIANGYHVTGPGQIEGGLGFTAPLKVSATINSIPTSVISFTGIYNGTTPLSGTVQITVSVTSGRSNINSDVSGSVILTSSDDVELGKVNFTAKKYSEPDPEPTPTQDPLRPTPTVKPTSSGGSSNPTQTVKPTTVVTPTPGPTPATLPPSEKTVTEVVTIPGSGTVPLTKTTTLESVTFSSQNLYSHNLYNGDIGTLEVVEGNTNPMLLPSGVSPNQVGKVIDLSVRTKDGEKVSNVKGSFIVTEKVPQGKKLIVAHGIDTANNEWRDAPVTFRGNDQHEIPFESLSPFLLILIDAGSANPLLSQPTETPTAGITAEPTTVVPTTAAPSATATKSPVPFFGLIAGLAAAGLVLSRK